jgi:YVTN family beta-propeller protein
MRRRAASASRVLTAVVFTDIVGSTELAARLGDAEWRRLLERQRAYVRANLRRFAGREVDTAGDGFFATFEVPAQAVLFALTTVAGASELGIELRSGVHMGEVERTGGGVAGMTVHIGARIAAAAAPSTVLVSSTVRDLATGADVRFEDQGTVELKGVAEPWHLYRAVVSELTSDQAAVARGDAAVAEAERQAGIRHGLRGAIATGRGRVAVVALVSAGVLVVAAVGWALWTAPVLVPSVPADQVGRVNPSAMGIGNAVQVGSLPDQLAYGGGLLWVTDATNGTLSAIDPQTRLPKGGPWSLGVTAVPGAVAYGAGSVWVADTANQQVLRFDPTTDKVVGQPYQVGNGPSSIVADDSVVWVANQLDGTLSRIDPNMGTGTVDPPLPIGETPDGLAIDSGDLWVSDFDAGRVLRLDLTTGEPVSDPISVGNGPTTLAADGSSVWVVNSRDGTVSRIDATTDSVDGLVAVGAEPGSVAAGDDAVWVTVGSSSDIARIDPHAVPLAVIGRIPVLSRPNAIALAGTDPWFTTQAAASSTGDEAIPHQGGTLRIISTADLFPPTIDPVHIGDNPAAPTANLILQLTNDGLIGYTRSTGLNGFRLVNDLAANNPVPSDGGRTYTFRLRSVNWSDGTPVVASDVVRTIERDMAWNSPGTTFPNILGADACAKDASAAPVLLSSTEPSPLTTTAHACGIAFDDGAGSVTFHLAEPDPAFLNELAADLAEIVPSSTPNAEAKQPLLATGPYMISDYEPGLRLTLNRNPQFREWSHPAQPSGYPETIEWNVVPDDADQVAMIERGDADWSPNTLPASKMDELITRFSGRLHAVPTLKTWNEFMNTKLPPFDHLEVRQAVNLATNRFAVIDAYGGPLSGRVTCQNVIPGVPGYKPYCPFTADAWPPGSSLADPTLGQSWHAQDLSAARALVDQSGMAGTPVQVWTPDDFSAVADFYMGLLNDLGFQASIKSVDRQTFFGDDLTSPAIYSTWQMAGFWERAPDPLASDFLGEYTCVDSPPPSSFCDHSIEQHIASAQAAEVANPNDPTVADTLWEQVDQEVTYASPAVVPFVISDVDFVSSRIGNFTGHWILGPLLDQWWVQ